MRRSLVLGGVGAAAIVGWWKWFTPWQHAWGATDAGGGDGVAR